MKSYLGLITISAKVRKRQNRMTLLCIVIAVFLVTAVFGLVDAFMKMEMSDMIKSHGHWHVLIQNISDETAGKIGARSETGAIARCDVINGEALDGYDIAGKKAVLYGVDEPWITDIRNCLKEGVFPADDGEILISPNAKKILNAGIGDSITLHTVSGNFNYTISGFAEHDEEFNRLYDSITVYMDRTAFGELCEWQKTEAVSTWYLRFKNDRGTDRHISKIKQEYGISEENIKENTAVLAVTGYSDNAYAKALYPIAAGLLLLIVAASVLMISSSMNSNVAQRTQFFGMMRCIGMSRKQVVRFVRLEALNWCKTAVPAGIVSGIFITWGLNAWIKYGIGGEFVGLPVFTFSAAAVALGAVTGVLSVFIAARSPAKRASKVSPAAAVSGSFGSTNGINRAMRFGSARIETALGINHAVSAKKNMILMTGSFALSIILFFGFSAGIDFVKAILPATRPWEPDFVITGSDGSDSIDKDLAAELDQISGVKHVFGIMASIDVPVISEKDIREATLISYDEYMFDCAEKYQAGGDFSKVSGDSNYVLTVYDARSPLEVGDKVTVNGTELQIAGIVSDGLFADDITLICTEETYERLMGESGYSLLAVQFFNSAGDEQVNYVRGLIDEDYRLSDYREGNKEDRTTFWAFRIIVYSFLAIIVLIAALNIINSTSMSVSARTKQYGAMRAVGMSGHQITKMIAAEVFTYAFFGCAVGCLLGLPLNKLIYESFITAYFGEAWRVPAGLVCVIILIMAAAALTAIYKPAKRMCGMAVTETINEL